jgi:hypothetical protein
MLPIHWLGLLSETMQPSSLVSRFSRMFGPVAKRLCGTLGRRGNGSFGHRAALLRPRRLLVERGHQRFSGPAPRRWGLDQIALALVWVIVERSR